MARRYGVRPALLLGIVPDTDEDSRIQAYHIDRAAAHAGVWLETKALKEAHGNDAPRSVRATGTPPTFNPQYGLSGRIPVSNEPIPDWLEALFPEGPIHPPAA